MVVECKQCGSKFKLDEGLLREEGSKVRCSVCKSVFRVYPRGLLPKGDEKPKITDQSLGETVTLDTHPTLEEQQPEPLLEDTFEAELAKALQEEAETKRIETLSPDQIPEDEEEELRFDFEESIKHEPRPEPSPASTLQREISKIAETPPKPEKPVLKKRRRGGLQRLLMVVLIVVLLLTGGAAAILYFAPEQVPESWTSLLGVAGKPQVKDPGVRRLSFKNVSGKFYQSGKAGNLFCIQGVIFNNYPGSRSFIRVKGSLLDEKMLPVKQKIVYAGNTFAESELKEMTLEQISEGLANRAGKGNANVNVKPQGSVPFMIVFDTLPENISEFQVEAVSSAPGQ
jgi:predicted Zn finger-like uncharacterized protein